MDSLQPTPADHTLAGSDAVSVWATPVERAMNRALHALAQLGAVSFQRQLIEELADLRLLAGSAWSDHVIPQVRRHEACTIARECPITWHGCVWPRGYVCDPDFRDRLYAWSQPDGEISRRGRSLRACTHQATFARSIRRRCLAFAEAIDLTALAKTDAAILAVDCGHLREAELSFALREGSIGQFVAADSDQQSLERIERDYGLPFPVIAPTPLGRSDYLGDAKSSLGLFDLIYVPQLFDSLGESDARSMLFALLSRLAIGGRLLVGMFADRAPEQAFIESIMDWPVAWRAPDELNRMLIDLPPGMIASVRERMADGQGLILEVTRQTQQPTRGSKQ